MQHAISKSHAKKKTLQLTFLPRVLNCWKGKSTFLSRSHATTSLSRMNEFTPSLAICMHAQRFTQMYTKRQNLDLYIYLYRSHFGANIRIFCRAIFQAAAEYLDGTIRHLVDLCI